MSTALTLNPRLTNFKNIVGSALPGMNSAKDSLSADIGGCKNLYESALNGVTSSWSDPNGVDAANNLKLVVSAVERLKNSIDADLGGVLSETGNVINFIDNEIIPKINEALSYKPGEYITTTDKNNKSVTEYIPNDDAKIDACNKIIKEKMEEAEKRLDLLISSMSAVSIGIVGMTASGSLGAWNKFNYNYQASKVPGDTPAETENPKRGGILQRTGATIISTVGAATETVVDTAEGVVDAVIAGAGWLASGACNLWGSLCSLFGADDAASRAWAAADSIEEKFGDVIEVDFTQKLHDSFYQNTGVGKWVSANSWIDPDGALYGGLVTAGSTAGKLVISYFNPVLGGVIAGMDAGGEKMQSELNSGATYQSAFGSSAVKGVIEGYSYYALGNGMQNFRAGGGQQVPTPTQSPVRLEAPTTPALEAPAVAGNIGPSPSLLNKVGITNGMDALKMKELANTALKNKTISRADYMDIISAFGLPM